MKIKIIAVGQIKENYLKDAIKEYSKRLTKYTTIEIIELKDESNKNKEDIKIKQEEGNRILQKINERDYVICCDLKGKMLDSIELSKKISEVFTYNSSDLVFIIGGSLGISEEVLRRADYKICFSKMTFPHQLMRVILLEQIYRSFKILNNETYHK